REDIIAQSKLFHDAGPVILEQHVGAGDELEQDRSAGVRPQVELNAALAAVVGDEIRTVLLPAKGPEGIAALRMLDLDHVGAEVGQDHAPERSRDYGAELDHAHALENC